MCENSLLHLKVLVQTHGGPCGVLAAVQAEMIRVLLFGRKRRVESSRVNRKGSGVGGGKVGTIGGCRGDGRDEDDNRDDLPDGDEDNDYSYFLYYPHEPTLQSATNADDTKPPSPITEREAKKAMGLESEGHASRPIATREIFHLHLILLSTECRFPQPHSIHIQYTILSGPTE
jgi:hypothetical protein